MDDNHLNKINISKNHNNSIKYKCKKFEKDIFCFINEIRKTPSKVLLHIDQLETGTSKITKNDILQITNFIKNNLDEETSLPPLISSPKLNKISHDLLVYLIKLKKKNEKIRYNQFDEDFLNLKIRALKYGQIKGKKYEAIIFDNPNLLDIIFYILKDYNGRSIIFNERIKYIGISCGYYENFICKRENNSYYKIKKNNICTVIDIIQRIELNNYVNSIRTNLTKSYGSLRPLTNIHFNNKINETNYSNGIIKRNRENLANYINITNNEKSPSFKKKIYQK